MKPSNEVIVDGMLMVKIPPQEAEAGENKRK